MLLALEMNIFYSKPAPKTPTKDCLDDMENIRKEYVETQHSQRGMGKHVQQYLELQGEIGRNRKSADLNQHILRNLIDFRIPTGV